MADKVVVKWGGGLITDKTQLCVPDMEVISSLVDTIVECHNNDVDVILVHGAGSFGHLKAKEYQLHKGFDSSIDGQEQAVSDVRNDMLTLNSFVMDELTKADISAVSLPPHKWARNTGEFFDGDLAIFGSAPQGIVMVTFGDVVDCDEGQFGILSGDDLVARLAKEVNGVKRLVFAIGGVDGLLAKPPAQASEEDLIEVWSPDIKFEGEHQSEIDVTGGIGLKAARGASVAQHGIEVWMVSGEHPERVSAACLGKETRGTRVVASNQ